MPTTPFKLICEGCCCAGIVCCTRIFDILKSATTPISKLVDIVLYTADLYSDFAFSKLLYDNCHYNYLAISLATIAVSYLTTVLYLKKAVRQTETWWKAIFYPVFVLKIVFQKMVSALSIKNGKSDNSTITV